MADKKEQEVQEVTTGGYEQIELFREQTPAEAAAETIAAIKRTLQEAEAIRTAPGYRVTDLLMKLDESATLAERCSDPRAIKTVCEAAGRSAEDLARISGNAAFENIAARLAAVSAKALLEEEEKRKEAFGFFLDNGGKYDPELDPEAPEFNRQKYRQALSDQTAGLREAAEALYKGLLPNSEIQAAVKNVSAIINAPLFETLGKSINLVSQYIEDHKEALQEFVEAAEGARKLHPFILREIEAYNANSLEAIKPRQVLAFVSADGEPITEVNGVPIENPFIDLIERAISAKEDFENARSLKRAAEQLSEDLPLLQGIIPDKHTMPNNALMNKMQKAPAINSGEFDLIVSGEKGKRKEITTLVKLDYDETQTGTALTCANMTEYERQVSDAVISLFLYGDPSHLMTADMIYRTMTGQSSSSVKAPPGQKAAITKFMNKWSGVRVTVDCSEEMRKRGLTDKNGKPIKQFLFDEYYLITRRVRAKTGSETVTAWQIITMPVILRYCEMTKQLLTVPAKMLDIKEVTTGGHSTTVSVQNNADRIAVKGNLLRKIKTMQGKKHNKQEWSNIISFDTVLEEIGLQDADKIKRQRIREYIFNCLDYWKAEHFIAGYKQRTKGRAITGVEIVL